MAYRLHLGLREGAQHALLRDLFLEVLVHCVPVLVYEGVIGDDDGMREFGQASDGKTVCKVLDQVWVVALEVVLGQKTLEFSYVIWMNDLIEEWSGDGQLWTKGRRSG